ncbi:pantetheine-phosphate adenylyltransferase [Hydrogenobaculum acidophilum]
MSQVIYPGTFDPPHLGHLDIVKRASAIFDNVFIAIARNPHKNPMFDADLRKDLFDKIIKAENLNNVHIEVFDTTLVEYAKSKHINLVIRGVRLFTDFEYELQISMSNYILGGLETLFMMPSQEYIHISSTIVRDLIRYKSSLKGFVHPIIEEDILLL